MLEADLMSKEGHFLPLEEGVKYLPNPPNFCILSSKTQKKCGFSHHFRYYFL